MVAHVDGRYICDRCGHTAYPGNTKYKLSLRQVLRVGGRLVAERGPSRRLRLRWTAVLGAETQTKRRSANRLTASFSLG
jgi:hypothetical protein